MANDKDIDRSNQMKMDYANQQLTQFLKDEFNLYAEIPYKANGRLRTSLGRIIFTSKRSVVNGKMVDKVYDYSIEYNKKYLSHATKEQVAAIGKHEALHYATKKLGLPCNDGHPDFESLLKKYNLPSHSDARTTSSASVAYTKELNKRPRHYAKCDKCGKIVAEWLRKPDLKVLNRKITSCCKAKPVYIGRRSTIQGLER